LNKLVAGLAISTIVCAVVAEYFHQQLIAERLTTARLTSELSLASAPRAPASSAVTAAPPVEVPAPTSVVSQVAAKPAVAAARAPLPTSAPPIMTNEQKAAMQEQAAAFLRKYETPEGKAALREEQIARTRTTLAGFEKEPQLDPATLQKVVEEVADRELERRAIISRCALDPSCVTPPGLGELLASRTQALKDLLGQEGYNEMQNWGRTESARRSVNGLSARLPSTAPLSSAQSGALVSALAGEREAAMRDFSNDGTHIKGFSNVDRMTLFYGDRLPEAARMASAEAYVQRMRASAATVLVGEQLIMFNQMQDELLLDFRRREIQRAAETKR
jgi:hypothetical protein